MLNYKNIKDNRQWIGTVGLAETKFYDLVKHFSLTYESLHGISLQEGSANLSKVLLLSSYEECLFYVLFQLKNSLCYDSLGLLIGTNASNARLNFEKYLLVLEHTLQKLGLTPKRKFKDASELDDYFKEIKTLLMKIPQHTISNTEG